MISKVAEMKINGLFKHSVDDIYCSDFYNLDMRCKYDDIDLLKYLLAKLDKENSVTSKNYKLIGKIVYCIDLFLNHLIENGKLEVNLFVKIIKFISEYDSSDEKNEEVDKYVLELKKSIAILIKRLNSNTLESVLKVVEKEKIDIIINSLDSDFINENLDKKEELNNEE